MSEGRARPLRVGVAIPAAGLGRRMGGAKKPYLMLAGRPVLLHALERFLPRDDVIAIRIAVASEDFAEPPPWLTGTDERVRLVAGGETRTDSVRAAMRALPEDLDVILVHDAARPLLSAAVLDRCIEVAASGKSAVAGYPAVDTLKEVDPSGRVLGTPERARFWHAQTPQAFPAALIRSAYEQDRSVPATDDSSLVERIGGTVIMVEASPRNLKVTRPEDLALAELFLAEPE